MEKLIENDKHVQITVFKNKKTLAFKENFLVIPIYLHFEWVISFKTLNNPTDRYYYYQTYDEYGDWNLKYLGHRLILNESQSQFEISLFLKLVYLTNMVLTNNKCQPHSYHHHHICMKECHDYLLRLNVSFSGNISQLSLLRDSSVFNFLHIY